MKRIVTCFTVILMMLCLCITAYATNENSYENTGDLLQDILGIAETQIGYTHTSDYSKYDSITQKPTQNRSASFISWCAAKAFISDSAIAHTSSVTELYDFFKSHGTLTMSKDYIPQAGDIIFIADNDIITNCGIVTRTDNEYVTAIIGDDDGAVKKKMYSHSLKKISGYATPDYTKRATVTTDDYITTPLLLNFRQQPTTSSEILDKIPKGTIIQITKIENDWGKITYNGKNGWISMDYAEKYDTVHLDTSRYGVDWNVIDISKFNGNINWEKLKEQELDGIIIRIGFRGTKTKVIHTDEKFFEFYNAAKEAGFYVGCYFYSGATTTTEVKEEASYIIDLIRTNNLEFDMPVYYDMEDDIIADMGSDNINEFAKTFLKEMDNENIFSGVYTNTRWMEDFFNPAIFSGHALWIADWRGECRYTGDFGMWQYSEDGKIDAIEENVDLNICYINYPILIKDKGYNVPPNPFKPRDKGDINGDGKINAADARLALRKSANLQTLSDIEFTAADYNSDGKVTAADARLILRKSAGLAD